MKEATPKVGEIRNARLCTAYWILALLMCAGIGGSLIWSSVCENRRRQRWDDEMRKRREGFKPD